MNDEHLPAMNFECDSGASATTSGSSISDGIQAVDSVMTFNEQEYETQFFGFTPKSFTDGLYNAIFDYMADYMDVMMASVNTECGFNIPDEEIRAILLRIRASISPDINKTFDKFEDYLTMNVFNIPSHVLLPEDIIHGLKMESKEDIEKMEQEIKELHDQIDAKKYVNECLRKELEEADFVCSNLDFVHKNQETMLNAVNSVAHEKGISSIRDILRTSAVQLATLESELNGQKEEEQPAAKKQKLTDEMM